MPGADRPVPAFAKFAAIGVLNTLADFGVFALLTLGLGWPPVVGNVVSYSCGVVLSFGLNQRFTFAATDRAIRSAPLRLATFYAGNLAGLGISAGIVWMLAPVLGPLGAKAVSIPLVMAFNFVVARKVLAAPPR